MKEPNERTNERDSLSSPSVHCMVPSPIEGGRSHPIVINHEFSGNGSDAAVPAWS